MGYAQGRYGVFKAEVLAHSLENIFITGKLQISLGYVCRAGLVAEDEVCVLLVADTYVDVLHKVCHYLFSLFAGPQFFTEVQIARNGYAVLFSRL